MLESVKEHYEKIISTDVKLSKCATYLQPLEINIQKRIEKLQNNSIVNLLIGIIGTSISIIALLFVLFSNREFADISKFLIFFLPRLTFVVSLQLFAFFFLRLYRNNLDDAKYFQNELTNISSKISALKVAVLTGNDVRLGEILEKLSNVERNFVLHKDDTLLSIEKSKIEKDLDLELLKSFKETFNVFKKETLSNGKNS